MRQVSKFIAWDYAEALTVLERYRETVLAVISGHDHDGAFHFDEQRNIAFLTLKGAVETSFGASAHYIAQISNKRITITGHNTSIVIGPRKRWSLHSFLGSGPDSSYVRSFVPPSGPSSQVLDPGSQA